MFAKYSILATLLLVPFIGDRVVVAHQNPIRLPNNQSIPLHYNVELTIDVAAKRFFIEESILIRITADTTTEIAINSNRLNGAWLQSRLVGEEDGRVYSPIEAVTVYDSISEVLYLRFGEEIIGGFNYTLHLAGIEDSFGRGLVEVPLSAFAGATDRFLLSTGFNVTNLRSLFPCFDQPEFRTTFNFTVIYPEIYNLLMNSDDVVQWGPVADRPGFIHQRRLISTPLPTHSIGFMLTNMPVLVSQDNRVRVYHPDPAAGRILLDTYHQLLLAVENELQMPEECPKLDIVYAPTLPMKTLTKWTLVMVSPEMNPVENSAVHSLELKEIKREIARSVYQMYFGQMISPEWWTCQWITLALARFYAAMTKHLPFDAEEEFVMDTVQMVLGVRNNFFELSWMEREPNNTEAINNPDLFMVDQRASVLMRMFANVMIRKNFLEAMLDFLNTFKFSTFTLHDFTDQLGDFTVDDGLLPEDTDWWQLTRAYATSLHGSESVSVHRASNTSFRISRWFTVSVDQPVDYYSYTIGKGIKPKFWLTRLADGVTREDILDPWIGVNPEQFGAYRVIYSEEMWSNFTQQLRVGHTLIPNRRQLIADSGSEAEGLFPSVRNHLFLIQYLKFLRETDVTVWRAVRVSYERLAFLMRNYQMVLLFDNYYNDLVGETYKRYRIGAEFTNFSMTMEVAKISCYSNYPECVDDVDNYYKTALENGGLTGSRDFQFFIYCTLARTTDDQEGLVADVLQLWTRDRSLYAISRTAVQGLACTSNATIINRFLEYAATNRLETEAEIVLAASERLFLLHTFMRGSYTATVRSLEYVLRNFVTIARQLDAHSMKELFRDMRLFASSRRVIELFVAMQQIKAEEMTSELRMFIHDQEVFGMFTEAATRETQRLFELFLQENALRNQNEPDEGSTIKAIALVGLLAIVAVIRMAFN